MRSILYFTLFLFVYCLKTNAQTNEEILKELSDTEDPSSFRIGVGLGNKVFSTHNNTLNAQQNTSSLVFTPSIGYYHKSGISLTATGYLLNSNGNSGLLQYAINPAYDYSNSDVSLSVSYTHYFTTTKYNTSLTPVQNDFFGSITSKKGWLRPGLQLGYSSGSYKEIVHVDTILKQGLIRTHYNFIDTSTTKLSNVSMSALIEHPFTSQHIFAEKDQFSFIPQILGNFGSSKQNIVQSSSGSYSFLVKRKRAKKRLYKNNGTADYSSKFILESLGLNLEGDYGIGKFDIQPDLYLDYYIPSTTAKRLTEIFSIIFTYSF